MGRYASILPLLLIALLACRPPAALENNNLEESPLRWYDRAGRVRFQIPVDWEIEEQPTEEEGLSIHGGHSPDNRSFVLLVSLSQGDLLTEATILTLVQEKFFGGPGPIRVEEQKINNLTGQKAEFVGTLGQEPVRALAFATRWRGAVHLLITGSQEAVAEKNMPRLEKIMKSFSGV